MEEKEKKLEKAPNSLIFVSLASMYLDNGMVDEAIDLCRSGLEIEPDNEEAHLILARAEIEKGNFEQAKQRLADIVEKNPDNTTAKELLDQMEPSVPSDVKVVEEAKPALPEDGSEPEAEPAAEPAGQPEIAPVEEMVLEGEQLAEPFDVGASVDEAIEEAIQAASQISGLIPTEEETPDLEELEEEPEEVAEPVEKEPIPSLDEGLQRILNEKITKLLQMEGIIGCFFRLRDGRIVKNPQMVGNVDDLIPLLDSLLGAVKAAAGKLELGFLELLMIEIKKGVFYIYSKRDFDCFLVSQHIGNFGFIKVMVPKILDDLSIGA